MSAISPLRGAAAHLWWSYYHAVKNREGVIAGTAPTPKTQAKKAPPKAKSVSNTKPVLNKFRIAKTSTKTTKNALPKKAAKRTAKKAGARK